MKEISRQDFESGNITEADVEAIAAGEAQVVDDSEPSGPLDGGFSISAREIELLETELEDEFRAYIDEHGRGKVWLRRSSEDDVARKVQADRLNRKWGLMEAFDGGGSRTIPPVDFGELVSELRRRSQG